MSLVAQSLSLPGRLTGVSARFAPGTLTAICGPNGAGKSSLLSALAGLLPPACGQVLLDDAPLASLAAAERACAIGYLAQSAQVAWDVSVETLVALGRIPHQWQGGTNARLDTAAIAAALSAMELEGLAHRPASQLSGGERARALLARVLAGQPRWILADEPLANLDLAHAAALMALLRSQAGMGTGVLVVLHDLASAMNHAQRVLVLDQGQIIADGPPHEALSEAVIARVWGIRAHWLGAPGHRALAIG